MQVQDKMRLLIFLVIATISFAFCKSKNATNSRELELPIKRLLRSDSLPFLDTLIKLTHFDNSNFPNSNVTQIEAEKCLYNYFRSKGIFSREELKKHKTNTEQICVDYDTIYRVRTVEFSGAVISYWLGPTSLNGHCFQPQKAIVRQTKKGWNITDEGFMPTNFAIDSVVSSNIYGFDYDCGGRGTLRHFKIKFN